VVNLAAPAPGLFCALTVATAPPRMLIRNSPKI